MQISYHSTLTKIQKLQNLKKKIIIDKIKKSLFLYRLVRPVFKPVRNDDVLVPMHIPVQDIPMVPAGTI